MNAKLHPIAREFLSIKLERSRSLKFIKIDAHQDDIKSFDQLTFFEKNNLECVLRVKKLITNTISDEIITFPLTINSTCVTNIEKQLMLNYTTKITTHEHLTLFKSYLEKTKFIEPLSIRFGVMKSCSTSHPKTSASMAQQKPSQLLRDSSSNISSKAMCLSYV